VQRVSNVGTTAGAKKAKSGKSKKTKKPRRSINYEKTLGFFKRLNPPYLDKPLVFAVLAMCIFGLAMVYSASWYNSRVVYGSSFYYVQSQGVGFVLGILFMAAAYIFDFHLFKKIYLYLFAFAVLLLLLVFVPGIGITKLGSSRWIGIGGFSMQPSEIAKFVFVIFASSIATGAGFFRKRKMENGSEYAASSPVQEVLSIKKIALILMGGLTLCALIFLEPNLSITLCLGTAMFITLFLYGAKIKHLCVLVAPAVVALPVMLIAEPYRVRRLLAFVDPWAHPKDEGFQLIQSLFGLGNGGFFGVGFLKSTQKYMFLPFAESDFIFSIIGEEFGFLGCVAFILLLAFIVWRVFKIGLRCPDVFGRFLCFGIAVVLFVQSAINLAVVTGTIPPTGVPLPFISFGGTSLAVYMGAIGIVLNVARFNKRGR
jgi:cell division protein FtsW